LINDAKILKKTQIPKIFQEKTQKITPILIYVIPLIYIKLHKKSEHPLLDAPLIKIKIQKLKTL
jgi:hypothetical protein